MKANSLFTPFDNKYVRAAPFLRENIIKNVAVK